MKLSYAFTQTLGNVGESLILIDYGFKSGLVGFKSIIKKYFVSEIPFSDRFKDRGLPKLHFLKKQDGIGDLSKFKEDVGKVWDGFISNSDGNDGKIYSI